MRTQSTGKLLWLLVLKVSELFGPTIQGEGPSLGKPASFLRLAICNLKCVWCDSKYTWDWTQFDPRHEIKQMSPDEVFAELLRHRTGMLVVTGGEPLLQKEKLLPILSVVRGTWSWRVEVETAGTIDPGDLTFFVDQFNVSPKLANSGNELKRRLVPEVLTMLCRGRSSIFKFVITDLRDLEEVGSIVSDIGIPPERVYIMPEGTDVRALKVTSTRVASEVVRRGWNLTTRLHIALWGNRRGV
ncbi:hypothetical protein LCGC14_1291440 [marine sediment metagenome]|uniref:Radical SAM core domain-containing protein n=1 Tax=marine sediment metagenome TaxID=412755 RepID=A0A0F9KTY3_9ZZZZ